MWRPRPLFITGRVQHGTATHEKQFDSFLKNKQTSKKPKTKLNMK